jgi:hypothetical protein
VDHDAAQAEGASSPVKYFGGLELGNAARDPYVPPDIQDRIQALAKTRGIDPTLAGHVMDQAIGARAVRDLMAVVRGESIPASTAKALTDMGMLQNEGGATPLKVTDDALHLLPPSMQNTIIANPGKLRFTRTSGQPADAMNQIVDQGMERFANTAKRLGQPADSAESQPAPLSTQPDTNPQTEDPPNPPSPANTRSDTPDAAAWMKGRVAGEPFTDYNSLRQLLAQHNVHLSVDPPFLRDDAPPPPSGGDWGPAAFKPLPGGKAMFYIRSDATRYEVLHELGHFEDWLKQGKPETPASLSEQAAYDYLRNNKSRLGGLNEEEKQHAHFYLLEKRGIPNFRKND